MGNTVLINPAPCKPRVSITLSSRLHNPRVRVSQLQVVNSRNHEAAITNAIGEAGAVSPVMTLDQSCLQGYYAIWSTL